MPLVVHAPLAGRSQKDSHGLRYHVHTKDRPLGTEVSDNWYFGSFWYRFGDGDTGDHEERCEDRAE
jgi:hypothetical protein